MKTTVVHHSADFDGLFCRQIAHKFLPDAELIGWDFGDKPLTVPPEGQIYILDLPVDRPFGIRDLPMAPGRERIIWIDHHASSIETHPKDIPGYRIDGVAACRLAWQWFRHWVPDLHGGRGGINTFWERPDKQMFIDRNLEEPLAVRLAGEYDIWDKRDPHAELFQFGLRSQDLNFAGWTILLNHGPGSEALVYQLLEQGAPIRYARDQEYRDVITQQGFDLQFEGLTFLACNSHECDIRSQLFEAGIKPHHDALLGFTFHGKGYRVSLYRIEGKDADILSIARKYGGGGHAGACGFQSPMLAPFFRPDADQPLAFAP